MAQSIGESGRPSLSTSETKIVKTHLPRKLSRGGIYRVVMNLPQLKLSESGLPPFPPENFYWKNDYIVDYPELIGLLSPTVISPAAPAPPPPEPPPSPFKRKMAIRELGIAVGIFVKRTIQNRKEQQHLRGNRTGKGSVLQGR